MQSAVIDLKMQEMLPGLQYKKKIPPNPTEHGGKYFCVRSHRVRLIKISSLLNNKIFSFCGLEFTLADHITKAPKKNPAKAIHLFQTMAAMWIATPCYFPFCLYL